MDKNTADIIEVIIIYLFLGWWCYLHYKYKYKK